MSYIRNQERIHNLRPRPTHDKILINLIPLAANALNASLTAYFPMMKDFPQSLSAPSDGAAALVLFLPVRDTLAATAAPLLHSRLSFLLSRAPPPPPPPPRAFRLQHVSWASEHAFTYRKYLNPHLYYQRKMLIDNVFCG